MLGYLESPPYFNSIWKDLEPLRYALETTLTKRADLSPQHFANQPYRNLDGEEEPLTNIDDEEGVPSSSANNRRVKSLRNKTVEVIRRMTRTVPGIRRLVDEFNGELGSFILFIHFVLCCIHRQSHFNSHVLDFKIIAKSRNQVFCKDRRNAPQHDGPAAKSVRRIELIRKLLEDPKLGALKSAADMGDFDPRPDPTIREELRLLYEELENFRTQNRDLTNKLLLKTVLRVARNSREKFAELDSRAGKILEQTQCPASRSKDIKVNSYAGKKPPHQVN